eukprot:88205_1
MSVEFIEISATETETETETDLNEGKLDEVLDELQKATNIKIFESREMTEKRRSIILKVEELTTLWIQKCLRANDLLPEHNIIESSSYICTFGSYELNAHF